ncbi:endosome/lysosome-associated apoptosis and autophagy regulator 1 [Spea bombifrons]|uniref:endosome/lysosome-associated apoptosis and autophagy regulator 1 n=1 Tax=Spea bombifrons TaxID=233779 RepID=UPI0023499202|nr:endosome/lysosome-associated apoptosis and autophagy regulator 1 [Spea bombifrons]
MPETVSFLASWQAPLHLILCMVIVLNPIHLQGQLLHACRESEYHYEYTECDSTGSRWRVAVPRSPGLCTGLPDPIKGTECSFSCSAGEYLDMTEQKCTPCLEGTYSLGTGVRFDDWTKIPDGFTSVSNKPFGEEEGVMGNCSLSQWKPSGEYVASNTDECSATLMYSINLKKEGVVRFDYLYPDPNIGFEFFVHNDQCQPSEEESRWMRGTEKGWSSHEMKLTQGNNVLYWRTTGFYIGVIVPKPVLLRNILITGAAYTSECFLCKAGTFAATKGTASCQLCPQNTFSNRGATACTPCDPDKYSDPGSASCIPRPPCTDKDYFYTHTPCDSTGETQLMYKWIEPKICSNNVKGAVQLPPSGVKTKCSPCNPGFFKTNSSSCEPCPNNTFSNGTTCNQCPVGTEAVLGFEYKWWNSLPTNMQTRVLSGFSFEYLGVTGWEVAGDHIYTSASTADNDFMLLSLIIPGFSGSGTASDDIESKEASTITFVFETKCSVKCQFFFMKAVNSELSSVVESWTGRNEKQSYTYHVDKNVNTTFSWAFQRTTENQVGRKYTSDVAKIYSINVTNTQDGVASWCRPCALGTDSLCVSCPPGNYIDKKTSSCSACPPNTYLIAQQPYGVESCMTCGPGTRNNEAHTVCFSDCQVSVPLGSGELQYDFSSLPNVTSFSTSPSFTNKGLRYHHHFSISLCGNQGRKLASCVDNVTDPRGAERESWNSVASYACQSIIVPSDTSGRKTLLSSQPISIADHLIGVTTKTSLDGISSPVDLFPGEQPGIQDIIFYYRSKEVTQSCSSGRVTTVRLRCNPQLRGEGALSVSSKCPEGTCDGCTFHFLWETEEACPLCTAQDYHIITSVCHHGLQRTTPVWRTPRMCKGGVGLPAQTVTICKTSDFWLKVGISSGICSALLLTVLTGYFWRKNRNLEYKYSRLMMNAPSKESELPAADSCAIMEGEDGEDEMIFHNQHSLLRKFMSLSGKRTSDGFDSVPLKSSEGADMEM